MTTLREVLRDALNEVDQTPSDDTSWVVDSLDDLGVALQTQLHANGLAIHDAARCVRPPVMELGRPMTDEEAAMVGLAPSAVGGTDG